MILSGTATDGTLGLDEIKTDGSITFAQDESVRDASMPCGALRGLRSLRRRTLRAPYVAGRKQEVSQKRAPASTFLNEPSHSKDAGFRRASHCL